MQFTKMHGLGNDFILMDGRQEQCDYKTLASELCTRRLSVGADGLIVVETSQSSDIRMRIFNADGSEAEMCGNGIRCFAKFVYDNKIIQKTKMSVDTLAGVMQPELVIENGLVKSVRVDMGRPSFEPNLIPIINTKDVLNNEIDIDGQKIQIASLLMGVPHTVVICRLDEIDFDFLGPRIEKHEGFPRKTNVNFVEIIDDATIKIKTWERGAGPTLACGTGSCASVVALCEKGLLKNRATVQLAAGELEIEYLDSVYMSGPAATVYTADISAY